MRNLLVITILLFSIQLNAQDAIISKEKKWYSLSVLRIQFAGEIGMISAGPTWLFSKDRLELTYSFGFVPEFAGGGEDNIYVTALKFEYTPNFDIQLSEKLNLKPLSVGAFLSHTFGKSYSKYSDISQYPRHYYNWIPSRRIGITYKTELTYFIKQRINKIGLYYEIGALDLGLMSRWSTNNYKVVSLYDIIFMSIGTKIYF